MVLGSTDRPPLKGGEWMMNNHLRKHISPGTASGTSGRRTTEEKPAGLWPADQGSISRKNRKLALAVPRVKGCSTSPGRLNFGLETRELTPSLRRCCRYFIKLLTISALRTFQSKKQSVSQKETMSAQDPGKSLSLQGSRNT